MIRNIEKQYNMKDLKTIHDIAENIGLNNIAAEITAIEMRSNQENARLILPLVGEFSSGKTTLINALTDCKKLETATKPTTATIYEVHFGSESCHAKVLNEQNETIEVNDISSLKNEALCDAKVVTVFDTSTKVPSSTILVDTPGLSSPDPKHKQTLVDFLPKADAVLLVSDINQQVTRSMTEFVKTMTLSKRPIFLVLTKSDTKSAAEVLAAKKYILDNIPIKFQGVACVSASKDDLTELYSIFETIQKDKNAILKLVNEQRVQNCITVILRRIDELLNSSSNDMDAENAIQKQKYELNKLKRNINNLIESMRDDISSCERDIVRRFDDTIFDRLDNLAANKSANFDAEAVSIINCTSSLLFNDYKMNIQEMLKAKVNEREGTDHSINLHSLASLDLSNISLKGFSYNLDLNSMGHEYDGIIASGVIVAAVGAALAVAAPAIGGSAAVAGAAEGATAAYGLGDLAVDALMYHRLSKVESENKKHNNQLHHLPKDIAQLSQNKSEQQSASQKTEQQSAPQKTVRLSVPQKKDVSSFVGLFTDIAMGKPQRRRAIHDYIDGTLLPEFKLQLNGISNKLVNFIHTVLNKEAEENMQSMTKALEELIEERKNRKEAFQKRINELKNYKTLLQNN